MASDSWLWEILSWISLPVIALLAGILVWRRLHRVFPLFFLFLLASELVGILRFVASRYGKPLTYFYVYWISDLVLMICSFLAVYELFLLRLFPKFYKVGLYRRIFALAAAIIMAAAWSAAFLSSNRGAWFAAESRVLSLVLVATLAFFASLMMIMGRAWTKYDFGVGFGFAINNAAILTTSAVWVRVHFQSTNLQQLPLIAFDLSCLLWLYCFWSEDKSSGRDLAVPVDTGVLHQARTWETMLKTWLSPGKGKR
ncbi:MAG TPA: hypothetical protein VKW06_10895 [Candidatus Angelobacter sp.]|nr:hypothetical protein [Candidatus Angelobacter sp.]